MCGIVGIFDFVNRRVEKEILVNMANTLIHRGPDDSGYYVEKQVGLGFRRLSIIDLESGNQPIYNEDKSIISVCNGEIFNYQVLKEDLQAKGHHFYTQCDVEVLVHLYEEYGTDFLNKINGQFAFAIFDTKNQQLFLARDQVGIIPLFYTRVDHCFIFGSEIKAILKHPLVKRRVDLTSLDQILSFPGIVSPKTMFENIYSLQPGHYLQVKDGKITDKEYWDLVYPNESDILPEQPEIYYLEKLDELLQQSIKYRLIADVPVGFYLSGGLDSSLIAALIHQLYPGKQRHSFSIGFTENTIDERHYQQLMVTQVNSIHHEHVFDWPDISHRFRTMVYHAETPLKETYNTCSLALSEAAKNNNTKVILTGEGSDELFAGYIGYRFDKLREEQTDSWDVETLMENQLREQLWGDSELFYERNQFEFRETKQALYSDLLNNSFKAFDSVTKPLVDKSKLQGRHPLHKRSYLDFKLRLSDHLLSDHGDRVATANSIEARFPFLDVNVIEFVKTIPPTLLVNQMVEKYILKQYALRYIPESIIKREKFAFVAPGSPYLLKQNLAWVNDTLSYATIKKQGYFNPETIERLKKMYLSDKFNLMRGNIENDLLMIVLTFGTFIEMFDMPSF
jgi:asparagine synthase (glutamine-hydrolysing)